MKYREVSPHPELLQFGELTLDLERQRLWRDGRPIDLPGLSFRLLEVLVRRAGQAVSRTELRREVWGGIVISDEALRQRVCLLRKALGDRDYIVTVKGIGYRAARPVGEISGRRRRHRLFAAAAVVVLIALGAFASGLIPEVKHAIFHTLRH